MTARKAPIVLRLSITSHHQSPPRKHLSDYGLTGWLEPTERKVLSGKDFWSPLGLLRRSANTSTLEHGLQQTYKSHFRHQNHIPTYQFGSSECLPKSCTTSSGHQTGISVPIQKNQSQLDASDLLKIASGDMSSNWSVGKIAWMRWRCFGRTLLPA